MSEKKPSEMTEDDWRAELSDDEFRILREAGTEPAFTGAYHDHKSDGQYKCRGCGTPLFDSETKFESGSGWPSFWDAVDKSKVRLVEDRSHGMVRTEVRCATCDGHLGHVFQDGPKPTGLRYCINSASLQFEARRD